MGDAPPDALELAELQRQWTHLYRARLPALAKARAPAQARWPVVLDHCFARVVLDNAVGVHRPWTEVVARPAVTNMGARQLRAAIALAEDVAEGRVALAELDAKSLRMRGKRPKADGKGSGPEAGSGRRHETDDGGHCVDGHAACEGDDGERQAKRRKLSSAGDAEAHASPSQEKRKVGTPRSPRRTSQTDAKGVRQMHVSSYFLPSQPPGSAAVKRPTNQEQHLEAQSPLPNASTSNQADDEQVRSVALSLISKSTTLTPFRKQTLSLLCQIPWGRYSTYGAMSDFISATSHKTCARAVGNAMRNNPFAPAAPCHRILAGDGTLGGFNGSWGESGAYAKEKHRLLREEGVKFDGRGKVVGEPFRAFWNATGKDR